MKFFSVDEIRSNRMARVLCDLKRGLPIAIAKKYLITSAEALSESNFNKLKQSFKDKLILITPTLKSYLAQKALSFSLNKIKVLCTPDNISNCYAFSSGLIVFDSSFAAQYYQLAKQSLTIAKLLPIFLLVELDVTNEKFLEDASIINIEMRDLISYKKIINSTVEQIVANVPVRLKNIGKVNITMFRVMSTGEEHIAIMSGNRTSNKAQLVRLHSSCYTGDLLQSLQCDCNAQLLASIRFMNEKPENAGVIIYLAQEGRGIGLANKLRTYTLQEKGYDTVEANTRLGFEVDARDYSIAAEILKQLKIEKIILLTNNPQKKQALVENGIVVSKVLPLMTEINNYNKKYMETKKQKMAHTI